MSGPTERKPTGARATLGLALMLTFLGTCGIENGVGEMTAHAPPESVPLAMGSKHVQQAAQQTAQALWNRPERRPLAAANIVVSAMLLLAGAMLVLRRRSARWWLTQTVIANVLWTVAYGATQILQAHAVSGKLIKAVEAEVAAASGGAKPALGGAVVLGTWYGMIALRALLLCGLYVWMVARVRRADVAAFLAEGPPGGPGPRPPRMP